MASEPSSTGAPERIRTSDTRFRRAVLYPLSYERKRMRVAVVDLRNLHIQP